MSDLFTPRRSVLYMPGANARALEKATAIPADALIFDLEDAVAPDAKVEARQRVCDAARSGAYGYREIIIRVNGIDTPWFADDVAAAAAAAPNAILVPKVNSAADIALIEEQVVRGGAPASTAIWAMLETPAGILNVRQIVAASSRLRVLVMGTNDIMKELHADYVADRSPLVFALSQCLLAAREGGKVIIDGVFNDITNAEGFAAETLQGRQMGFDGKTLIHPSQVEPCNEIYAPSADDVTHARRVIAAFDEAQADGRGVVTVDGRMIENLHVENARRTLAISDALVGR